MKELGAARLPVLDRAGRGSSPRGTVRSTRPGSTSTTGSSTSWSAPASSRWRRSTTGTCRRRCRPARGRAAGSRARPPSASGSTPPSCAERLADRVGEVGAGQRAQRGDPGSATASASTHPVDGSASTRCPSPTTSTSRTGWRSRRCARTAPGRSAPPPTTRRCGPPRTGRRTSPPPTCSTRCGTGSSPTRCCSAATPRASRRCCPSRTATSRRSASRSTSTASTTTTRCGSRPRRRTPTCRSSSASIPGYPQTDFGWPIVPDGLRQVIGQLVERYPGIPPLYITENGCSYGMGPDEHGVVDDQPRIDYLDSHLRAVGDAIADGADVRGYYCWSLMDNFEWAEGYTQRFGLVHVDYDTLVRTPKRSFAWYAEMIAAPGVSVPLAGEPSGPADLTALAEPRPAGQRGVGRSWLSLVSVGVWSRVLRPDPGAARPAGRGDQPGPQGVRALARHPGRVPRSRWCSNPLCGAFSDRTCCAWAAGCRGCSAGSRSACSRWSCSGAGRHGADAWCSAGALAQVGLNAMLAAITATVPDQVPVTAARSASVAGWRSPRRSASSPGRASPR